MKHGGVKPMQVTVAQKRNFGTSSPARTTQSSSEGCTKVATLVSDSGIAGFAGDSVGVLGLMERRAAGRHRRCRSQKRALVPAVEAKREQEERTKATWASEMALVAFIRYGKYLARTGSVRAFHGAFSPSR